MRLNQGSYRTACLVPTACVHTQDESQVFMAKPVVGQGVVVEGDDQGNVGRGVFFL